MAVDDNSWARWQGCLDVDDECGEEGRVEQFINGNFQPTIENIPAGITCPGSMARQFFTCYSHPAPALCAELPGCASMKVQGFSYSRKLMAVAVLAIQLSTALELLWHLRRMAVSLPVKASHSGAKAARCFPKWFTSASTIQQVAHRQSIAALDPRFFGSCHLTSLLNFAVVLFFASPLACLFRYISESKTCFRKIWATDQSVADDTVNRLYQACYGMRDQKSCEGRPPVLMQQLGTYRNWTPDLGGGQCSLTQ
eukprot:gene9267-9432_t